MLARTHTIFVLLLHVNPDPHTNADVYIDNIAHN